MRKTIVTIAALGALAITACVSDTPLTPRTAPTAPGTGTVTASAVTAAPVANADLASIPQSNRYLVVFKAGSSAADAISAELRANGGQLEGLYQALGFAVVSGISPQAAARLASAMNVSSVEPDVEFSIARPIETEAVDMSAVNRESAAAPQTAALFSRQWNMRAIAANVAWAGGALGSSNVSVAILDTGIDYLWPDLAGRVDLTRSISLRPDEDARQQTWFGALNRHTITDLNGHGTLVSSIVASNATFFAGVTSRTTLFGVKVCTVFGALNRHTITDLNGHGTLVSSIVASNATFFAGVTSRTTLFGVKVCTVFGSCSTSAILNGIVYAVDHGADVINMSLGGAFPKNAAPGFVSVINRVFNYANTHGTLIVVAAGNESSDIDHNGNVYNTYCNTPNVVCVSATGPTAATTSAGPFTNPDAIAPYTNFGRSAISVAAPGGGVTTANAFVSGPCSSTALLVDTTGTIVRPLCPLPGLVLLRGAATSFSPAHVAGGGAAVIAARGRANPAQVRAILEQTADDLGEPGTDPFYGRGRVNAARAVGAIP